MFQVIVVIFLALLFYFMLKMVYNIVILVVIGQLIAKFKAKGEEILKKGEWKENGETE